MNRTGTEPALENSRDRAASGPSPERKPFKQIPVSDLLQLCRDLPPAALKVWLYHFGRSKANDASYAKLERIAAETNQSKDTVKIARRWLRANGWLELAGHVHFGRKSLPKFRCSLPRPKVEKPPSVPPPKAEIPASVRQPRVEFPPTEVDLNPEVDGKPEVEGLPRQLTLRATTTPVLPFQAGKTVSEVSECAPTVWRNVIAYVQSRVNPHSFDTWFRPIRPESLAGSRLVLRAPGPMWVKRLTVTYGAVLREALADIGRAELSLELIVCDGSETRAP